MAHCPPAVMVLWNALSCGNIVVASSVWQAWDKGFSPSFDRIRGLARRGLSEPLFRKDLEIIMVDIVLLQKFLCSVRRSTNMESHEEGGYVYFSSVIKDLLAHHIGNDLYKVALLADAESVGQEGLPTKVSREINENHRSKHNRNHTHQLDKNV